ncbi:SRPBCC family protein [Streptomyces sp. SCL15-4]|uniref:SRPBCC family protein n=1 Tax=Streptomyces sp. SCL15-4 TaxID=2967221 RepID=UPI00296649B3|nr:SRPBCC domain-containing protein [Streptomyces sp. SCL15-4]
MEHQVFVQASTERLGAALADPARVARAVPGLQQDAGAEPITGRLKLRVGGHSVTYRGTARVTARADGTYAVEADAGEARGSGTVELALTLRLTAADGGCAVTAEGTATATGRITELPPEQVTAAATRLLDRFLQTLAAQAGETAEAREQAEGEEPAGAGEAGAVTADEPPVAGAGEQPAPRADADADEPPAPSSDDRPPPPAGTPRPSVFDTEVPPPSLDRDADAGSEDTGTEGTGTDGTEGTGSADDRPVEDFADTGQPPAEAAHARRTMIGRSAEEVDHAPPRGRYAPVPAPQTVAGNPALRWAAPAAAVALASAVVVTRALRRRR